MRTVSNLTQNLSSDKLAYTVSEQGELLKVEFPTNDLPTEYTVVEAVAAFTKHRGCWPTRLIVNPSRHQATKYMIALSCITVEKDAGCPANVVLVGMEVSA